MPAAPATRTTRRRARSRSNGSSRASRERAHSLLEVRERDRRPQRIAADDRARAGYRGPHRGRVTIPPEVAGGPAVAETPRTEPARCGVPGPRAPGEAAARLSPVDSGATTTMVRKRPS